MKHSRIDFNRNNDNIANNRRPQQLKSDFDSFYMMSALNNAVSNAELNNTIQNVPTAETPFNSQLYVDVSDDIDLYIKRNEKRPIPTKFSNGAVIHGDKALYDPRHMLNYGDVYGLSDNYLLKTLDDRAKSKIVQRNYYQLPIINSEPSRLGNNKNNKQYVKNTNSESNIINSDNNNYNKQYVKNINSESDNTIILNELNSLVSHKPILQDYANDYSFSNYNSFSNSLNNDYSKLNNQQSKEGFNISSYFNNSSGGNGMIYNPNLVYSQTNYPIYNNVCNDNNNIGCNNFKQGCNNICNDYSDNIYPQTLLDERIDIARNRIERPWNYTTDRIRDADMLANSDLTKQRQQLQHEADDAFLHRAHKYNRYSENSYAYHKRPHDERMINENVAKNEYNIVYDDVDDENNVLTINRSNNIMNKHNDNKHSTNNSNRNNNNISNKHNNNGYNKNNNRLYKRNNNKNKDFTNNNINERFGATMYNKVYSSDNTISTGMNNLTADNTSVITPHYNELNLSQDSAMIDRDMCRKFTEIEYNLRNNRDYSTYVQNTKPNENDSYNDTNNIYKHDEMNKSLFDKFVLSVKRLFNIDNNRRDELVDNSKRIIDTAGNNISEECIILPDITRYDSSERQRSNTNHFLVQRNNFDNNGLDNAMIKLAEDNDIAGIYVSQDNILPDHICKTLVFTDSQNGKTYLRVIQQRPRELILQNDSKPLEDDYLVTSFELDDFDKDFVKRLKLNNNSLTDRKPLNIKYDDFVELCSVIDELPSKQERLSFKNKTGEDNKLALSSQQLTKFFDEEDISSFVDANTINNKDERIKENTRYKRTKNNNNHEEAFSINDYVGNKDDVDINTIQFKTPLPPDTSYRVNKRTSFNYATGGNIRMFKRSVH